jgi:hypothetical protein
MHSHTPAPTSSFLGTQLVHTHGQIMTAVLGDAAAAAALSTK